MSCFRKQTTELTDKNAICDALKAMGYKPEVSEEKKSIRGHYGETGKAEIIVKKEDLGDGGDIGLSKEKDGTFALVADTYVLRKVKLDKFGKDLKMQYGIAKARKIAREANMEFLGLKTVTKAGKTVQQMQFRYLGK